MFSTTDTIAAIATAPGHGAIGIVRLSGSDAHPIALRLLAVGAPLIPRHATFTKAILGTGSESRSAGDAVAAAAEMNRGPIDHVVATYFPRPHSYTGEDVVEIAAHGSPIVLETILRAALSKGARLAEPGEFTLRAFLNDRIDLVQAEAVADLVEAVTPLQARAAFDQLEGTLTAAIADIERSLFDLAARLEASIDFPDEGYHFISREEVAADLATVRARLESLVAEGQRGRIVREGRQVAIAGRPNVGKSTLFNALLGSDRAIVTPVAGTTRDLITETTEIAGVRVCLVDTAGVRHGVDAVEREGVERARSATAVADLVVVVLDLSRPLEDEDRELLQATERAPRVVVANKRDLPAAWTVDASGVQNLQAVSLLIREDVAAVRAAIAASLAKPATLVRDVPAVTNVRHVELLGRALTAVKRAESETMFGQTPEEFLLADLQKARGALEEVTGRRTNEDLLRQIFSRFCIGK